MLAAKMLAEMRSNATILCYHVVVAIGPPGRRKSHIQNVDRDANDLLLVVDRAGVFLNVDRVDRADIHLVIRLDGDTVGLCVGDALSLGGRVLRLRSNGILHDDGVLMGSAKQLRCVLKEVGVDVRGLCEVFDNVIGDHGFLGIGF